jgi:hypothetical protein
MGRVVDRAAFRAALGVALGARGDVPEAVLDDQPRLARLLFHGAEASDDPALRALFPARDFVIWEADAF